MPWCNWCLGCLQILLGARGSWVVSSPTWKNWELVLKLLVIRWILRTCFPALRCFRVRCMQCFGTPIENRWYQEPFNTPKSDSTCVGQIGISVISRPKSVFFFGSQSIRFPTKCQGGSEIDDTTASSIVVFGRYWENSKEDGEKYLVYMAMAIWTCTRSYNDAIWHKG